MREAATPPRPPLALIVNDQEWTARSLESILAPAGYSFLRVSTAARALEQARSAPPDLILLDLDLPDGSGIDLCRRLREDPRIRPNTPILITTASAATRQRRLDALRAGAWEFLGLPVDVEELQLKLEMYLAAKAYGDRASEEGLVDQSSGLYNSRGLLRRARELLSEAARYRRPLACVAFGPSLTGKRLGEAGADAGAETASLRDRLVSVFRDLGRTSDAVGRLGPTEFVVLAPATDPDGAVRLAERVLAAARDGDIVGWIRVGAYAITGFDEPKTANLNATDLLLRATTALRKSQGERQAQGVRFFRDAPTRRDT